MLLSEMSGLRRSNDFTSDRSEIRPPDPMGRFLLHSEGKVSRIIILETLERNERVQQPSTEVHKYE